MRARMPIRATLVALLLLWPGLLTAQEAWDADVYTDLIATGRSLHDQALEEAPGSPARRDLLVASLSANRQAQHMLRAAIVEGAVDAYRADAVNELFNLSDNIIVELMALDQCDAAAVELERVADEEVILPPDAGSHIDTLRERVEECRTRVANAPGPWDQTAYVAKQREAARWRERAAGASTDSERMAALYEATEAEEEALDRLQRAVRAGQPLPGVDPARQLGVHYNRIIASLLEMGLCETAASRIAERDAAVAELGSETALSDYAEELARCRTDEATAVAGAEAQEAPIELPPPQVVESESSPWPWILIGGGATAAVAALTVDISLAGDRSDFDDLQARCDDGGLCNYEALSLLGDQIDRQKIVIGVLSGVALAAGATGIIWLLVRDDEEGVPAATLEVAPMAGPGVYGASVRILH